MFGIVEVFARFEIDGDRMDTQTRTDIVQTVSELVTVVVRRGGWRWTRRRCSSMTSIHWKYVYLDVLTFYVV